MKSLKPIHILLAGSSIVSALTFILLVLFSYSVEITTSVILGVSISVWIFSYFSFYFFLKYFITERIRILYRSIRKGKFNDPDKDSFLMSNDVIEQAELETREWTKQQNEEISKLKEQEEFRREFIGNLAHELKTPVFSIQGYILTLLEGGLEDENVNRSFLERASKATDRMTMILEDLDQLTKMEVSEVILDMKHFDIKVLVQEIFEELEMKAKDKQINLVFAKEFDPVYVHADRNKIAQVLMNLIGNSIYYGNLEGETQVRFYLMDNIVTVEVSDNGPGIEEEHIPRLFERFYRVEKSRNRNQGGSGLGLAIAKHFIVAHGQTINVRSTPGIGSTFTFSLDKGKKTGI